MIDEQRTALETVQFNSALTPDDVWNPVTHHVEGLHSNIAWSVLRDVQSARKSAAASPIGVVLQGERGVGKTHMLRWLRHKVQAQDGYFFLVKLLDGTDFWRSAVHGVVDGFYAGQGDQLTPLLNRLCVLAELSPLDRTRVVGMLPVLRDDVDALVAGLAAVDRQVWAECQNTLRALVLYRARDLEVQEIGYRYLTLDGDVDDVSRSAWGFKPGARSRQLVLRDLSRLLALTGPTVIAVDQIDPLITQAAGTLAEETGQGSAQRALMGGVANGLMELREVTRRTLSIVACLPGSWKLIADNALISAPDRFRVATLPGAMPDADVPRAIVREHLGSSYAQLAYEPPSETWPVAAEAFTDGSATHFTPRRLLQRVDAHVRRCLEADQLSDATDVPLLTTFAEERIGPVDPTPPLPPEQVAALDEQFAQLRKDADVDSALDKDREDLRMPGLLTAGLTAYVAELGEGGQQFAVDRIRGKKPPLHARLRQTLDEQSEDEVHYAFKAVSHPNAIAVQARLRSARTEAGVTAGADRRKLVLVRNTDWPNGAATTKAVDELYDLGAVRLDITDDDLRTFAALEAMQQRQPRGFVEWLSIRGPAGRTALFTEVFGEPADRTDAGGEPVPAPADETTEPLPDGPVVAVGRSVQSGRDLFIGLEALRKHTAVFAGSGSGKTVLLRRLVEECALHGVSAIVLDPNNDLSRLGDPWPTPPEGWLPGDGAKAAEYLANTDVVVWTPRRSKGRPLAFQPLPDFSPVLNDDDEFGAAVDSAVASLVPRAGLSKAKLEQGKAVLKEALEQYARDGGSSLTGYVDLLEHLPEGISGLKNGPKLAAAMAEHLQAAMINDPLFGGEGTPVDPAVLLTPPDGKRARISVISFVGLPSDAQRQSFVNQLQMALFSWVKANPAGDRPLGGLFVMDEAQTFAPSGALTACTQSTISLASQARKYGLGLVFATQAPKGIHNQITGNAATQFFGFLNSGAQIAAAKALAADKGGHVAEISALTRGQFYVAAEGHAFEKVSEPMCLSHHPASPPTAEEVIERAAQQG